MLLIDIHELDVILANPVRRVVLEDEVHNIRRILSLDGENVLVLGSAEHFGERAKIDTEGDVAIAAERCEGFGAQQHGYESNVGVVHGLEGNARVIAVKVAVLDKVLDCVDNLM